MSRYLAAMSGRRVPSSLVVLAVAIACAGNKHELYLEGRAGESCESCSDSCLEDIAASCQCETCTTVGYDAEARELLDCSAGVWSTRQRCPGGVSVECAGAGYRISCRDADGNELPRN